MFRVLLVSGACSAFIVFLKAGYGYRDGSWAAGSLLLILAGATVAFVDHVIMQRLPSYWTSLLAGLAAGGVVSSWLSSILQSMSFVAGLTEGFPLQNVLNLVLVFFFVLIAAYWSGEEFCLCRIAVSTGSSVSGGFSRFRLAARLTTAAAFAALFVVSWRGEWLYQGETAPPWLREMAALGYDFEIKLRSAMGPESVLLWFIFAGALIMEWILGRFVPTFGAILALNLLTALLAADLAIRLVGTSVSGFLPSDLFQMFSLTLACCVAFLWLLGSLRSGVVAFPFVRFELAGRNER